MRSAVDGRTLRYAGRREELLDQASAWVLEQGLANLSLRAVSSDLGISHRTLLHHFPTKQQLIAEILRELRARSVTVLMEQTRSMADDDPRLLITTMWEHFAAPENLPYHRLFFEAYGASLSDRERYSGYLEGFDSDWGDAIATILERNGVARHDVAALARLTVAGYRGLLLDLLVTDDRVATRAALDRLADLIGDDVDRSSRRAQRTSE